MFKRKMCSGDCDADCTIDERVWGLRLAWFISLMVLRSNHLSGHQPPCPGLYEMFKMENQPKKLEKIKYIIKSESHRLFACMCILLFPLLYCQ